MREPGRAARSAHMKTAFQFTAFSRTGVRLLVIHALDAKDCAILSGQLAPFCPARRQRMPVCRARLAKAHGRCGDFASDFRRSAWQHQLGHLACFWRPASDGMSSRSLVGLKRTHCSPKAKSPKCKFTTKPHESSCSSFRRQRCGHFT